MTAQLSWDDLHSFAAVAEAGTLSAGGERLGVNHSTVLRRISRLEDQLSARLFDRSSRGYSLTPAGEQLYAHVQAMQQEAEAIQRKLGGFDSRLEGTVRVSTVDDLALVMLNPIMAEFLADNPGITLDVGTQPTFADLSRREADVAFRFGVKPEELDLVCRRVASIGVAVYASPAYLADHGRPSSLTELDAHALVRGDEHMRRIPMEQALEQSNGRTVYRSHSMLLRSAAIRAGVGLGFLPYFLAEGDPGFERLELDTSEYGSTLWMLIHSDLRRNAKVRAFVDHTLDALASQRERFEGPSPTHA